MNFTEPRELRRRLALEHKIEGVVRLKILVTGAAGFIGSFVAERLLKLGHEVVGIDNLNEYYDPRLKHARLERLRCMKGFSFQKLDISHRTEFEDFFRSIRASRVVHLAAQAGVRYSVTHPYAYIESNIVGFLNLLEQCRHQGVEHLVYASTSSVYGLNTDLPFSAHRSADHQVSLYGATKKANESMAHSYSHMYGIPTTGLRFFTVYGPWGRPDMALFQFTKNIVEGKPIDIFNHGNHKRDFTYVDDIAEGVVRVTLATPPSANSSWDSKTHDSSYSSAPYKIYNIGNNKAETLIRYIEVLEKCLGRTAKKNYLPLQPGDINATEADVNDLERDFNYRPQIGIDEGIRNFVEWYRGYYGV